jgi:hypothetical protein
MRITSLQSRPIGYRPALLALLLTMVMLASASVARADIGETIIQRCTHGESLSGFPPRAYSRALKQLSADAEEYTDCASLIRQAQVAAASGRGGGGGGGTGSLSASPVATAATPSEQRSVAGASKGVAEPVRFDGQVIRPGVVHANVASAFSTLPAPLLAMLALMLACLLAVAGGAVRNRVRAGRSA